MKKEKSYTFSEYPEAAGKVTLLDGKERRIRLTLATVRRFESFQLVDASGVVKHLDYESIAELLWAVLLDKEDLAGPAQLLELVTAAMLPELLLAIQDTASAEGTQLKNGWARVQARAASLSRGPNSTPSAASSLDSAPPSSGRTPPANFAV